MFQPHPDVIPEPWPRFIAVMSTLTFLSTLTIFLRIVERWTRSCFGWDDWTMFASFFSSLGFLALFILCPTVGGAGYHVETYTIPQLNTFLKIIYAGNIVYNASVCLSKASVIFYYRRIFAVNYRFHIYTNALLVALSILFISEELGLTFAYNPVEAQWNVGMPHTEINSAPFWLTCGITYIIFDILILVTPLFQVWKLKLTFKRKLLITGLFLLGSTVAVATLLRLIYVATVDFNDLTYTDTNPALWAGIEISLSIICMNLPIVYTLWREVRRKDQPKLTPKGTVGSSLITFGSKPSRPKLSKKSAYENLELTEQPTAYEAYIEAGDMAETASTAPLSDVVQVQRSYRVV
ncbi:hypothetical protein NUW58_g2926 [Xylaria curta]|uniref:Uncharacterized protein n=1 Tax=Xylaria curta TaxID=42375 RepID=A0ACC1PDU0_9PEZI|nr:hypothetical protein NUW58_g2926 [Xylaria curta]